MAVWLSLPAASHPFGARFAAHLLELQVDDGSIQVNYLADVPNPLVQTATQDREADPVEAMAQELRSGLVLEVDGVSVSLEPTSPWSAVATEDTHQFQWTFRANLDTTPRRVELSNANLPDVAAVHRARVTLGGTSVPTGCSLWRMRDNEIALDDTDRWRTGESHRALTVDLDRPAGPLSPVWNLISPAPATAAIAADRWLPPLRVAIRTRTLTPGLGSLALATLAALLALPLALVRVARRRAQPRPAPR